MARRWACFYTPIPGWSTREPSGLKWSKFPSEKSSMSSLQRYKKAGGFHQLVSLIETFGHQKQEKFLEMIEAENASWAHALRDKMISLGRIMSWPDQVIVEIFKALPPATMDHVLIALPEDQRKRVTQFLSHGDLRRIDEVAAAGQLKTEETASVLIKLVESARKLVSERTLHPDRFDPLLMIPDDFEVKLEQHGYLPRLKKPQIPKAAEPAVRVSAVMTSPASAPESPDGNEGLKATLQNLLRENKALREEIKILKEKLDQIRRIA